MICSACQRDNPIENAFCGGCGHSLASPCPRCKADNPPANLFCDGCGTILERRLDAAEAVPPSEEVKPYTPTHLAERVFTSRSAVEGERKHVTVLFADVKDSLAIARSVDPESWHRILDGFFKILTDAVHRADGTINQYTGDGVMALFGAPVSIENHAARACDAALQTTAAIEAYGQEVEREYGVAFAVRIGLNSGEVVVGKIGDGLRADYTAQGETVGVAQRMEALAEPNACYASQETARLAGGYFDFSCVGQFDVRGVGTGVSVFALRGAGPARARLDVSRRRGFSRFVGRDAEMEILERALGVVSAGSGRVAGVAAAAGTGKSRLCHEFTTLAEAAGASVFRAQCLVQSRRVDNAVARQLLRDLLGAAAGDDDDTIRRKAVAALGYVETDAAAGLELVLSFLGISADGPAADLSADERRARLAQTFAEIVRARAADGHLVIYVDDAHWIDPGTDALLARLIESTRDAGVLWLINYRPEYEAGWMVGDAFTAIRLEPLSRTDIEAMLREVLGTDESVAGLPRLVFDRTQGNPFFIEEIVRSLIDAGTLCGRRGEYRLVGKVEVSSLPATVSDLISARIDGLADRDKFVLQAAAVLGRRASEAVLARTLRSDRETLRESLNALSDAEFLSRADGVRSAFTFTHPLTQEVAYGAQLGDNRKSLHARAADAIEEIEFDRLDENAGLIAEHWSCAGEREKAAVWHKRAALVCGAGDPAAAFEHWRRVLELTAEGGDARLRLEASVGTLATGWQRGMDADAAAAIHAEGQELAFEAADFRARTIMSACFSRFYSMGGQPSRATPIAEQTLAVAERCRDASLVYVAHAAALAADYHVGRLQQAERRCLELYRLGREDLGWEFDGDGTPVAHWLTFRALVLMHLGRLGDAGELLREADAALAGRNTDSGTAWNEAVRALLSVECGEIDEACARAERVVELAERSGTNVILTLGYQCRGAAMLESGNAAAAVTAFERAIRIARRSGGLLSREADLLAGLSESRLACGELDLARQVASQAVSAATFRGTPVFEITARLAAVRAGVASRDDAKALRAELERIKALIGSTGARLYEPYVFQLRGDVAEARGDRSAAENARRRAQESYESLLSPGGRSVRQGARRKPRA